MKICPLTGNDCIGENCAWFVRTEGTPKGECAVYVLGKTMGNDIALFVERLREG